MLFNDQTLHLSSNSPPWRDSRRLRAQTFLSRPNELGQVCDWLQLKVSIRHLQIASMFQQFPLHCSQFSTCVTNSTPTNYSQLGHIHNFNSHLIGPEHMLTSVRSQAWSPVVTILSKTTPSMSMAQTECSFELSRKINNRCACEHN